MFLEAVGLSTVCSQLARRPQRTPSRLDSEIVADYRRWGCEGFPDNQLHPHDVTLPAPIAAEIAALEVTHPDPVRWLADVNVAYKATNATPAGPNKERTREALTDRGNKLELEAMPRDLLRGEYTPSQLQEQMVWFCLNHFSVYQVNANLRSLVGDYEERAIRPHVFRRFKDLVLATIEHPAVLQYLDNCQKYRGTHQ